MDEISLNVNYGGVERTILLGDPFGLNSYIFRDSEVDYDGGESAYSKTHLIPKVQAGKMSFSGRPEISILDRNGYWTMIQYDREGAFAWTRRPNCERKPAKIPLDFWRSFMVALKEGDKTPKELRAGLEKIASIELTLAEN